MHNLGNSVQKASKKPLFVGLDVTPSSGGPYKSVNLFRQALGGKILSFGTNAPPMFEPGNIGSVDHCRVPNVHYFSSKMARCRISSTYQPSLISCHQIFRYHNVIAKKESRRLSIPYWSVPHGSMDPWVFSYGRLQKELWLRAFGTRYFRNASHIILATERERDKMRMRYDGSNMHVVHWPVETLDVAKKQEARASLRERLGLCENARLLLYFGRYHSMKRPVETIELFKEARLSKETHLLMVGFDGDVCREELKCVADGSSQVHVWGAARGGLREEVLLGADAYISLSHRENFNHTAAEAMTGGQALILSAGNDLQYSFPADLSAGWMLEDVSDEEVIAALRSFDQMREGSIFEMGERGRQWAIKALSFEKFRGRLLQLYNQAVSRC